MGNNQASFDDEAEFDASDLSQWTLAHITAIDRAFRARSLEFAVDKGSFRHLLGEPYDTAINGIPVHVDAPLPGVDDATIDYFWRLFSFVDGADDVERVVPAQVLAGVVSKARGPLCEKVDVLFQLYDMMDTGEMGYDEMLFTAQSALGGMVTLENIGRQPQQKELHKLLKDYWMKKRVYDFQERSFSRREFQEMVMGMLLENWMKGYGTCHYHDEECEHGWVKEGELRYKQLYMTGPVAERDMWASSAMLAEGEAADAESMLKQSGMLTNLMVEQAEGNEHYGEKADEGVTRANFLKKMLQVDGEYEAELAREEQAKRAAHDPHPSVVESIPLPEAGSTTGLFEYYYKHFRYYQHGMPENADDPESAIEIADILATFGLCEISHGRKDARKVVNLTEGMGVNSAETAHSAAVLHATASLEADAEARAASEREAAEAAEQQPDGITTPGHVSALYLDLACPLAGDTVASIDFASYGSVPAGACGSFAKQPPCAAANASAVVAAACVGQPSCRVWPNTTTFGDPCFGTAKRLVVQLRCRSGPGTATPGCDATQGSCAGSPTPAPAPPAPASARVVVDWSQAVGAGPLATEPSLQVVAHGLLMRDSPLHDRLFGLLRDLGARRVRYVPWLPTPLLGVAALEPPTATATSWNFTLLDQQFLDVWRAVQGGDGSANQGCAMIPNFSTPPTWLYDGSDWSYSKACTQAGGCKSRGYEKGVAPAAFRGGLAALGDYYGRLLAWYTRGGFTDELGVKHTSGHFLNITTWEIFNEPDYEHGHTVQSYTEEFDAIVAGIRRHADPGRKMRFVGMNNPNIDDQAKVVGWAEYFLNASNHAPDVRDALGAGGYIGYHAYPTAEYPMRSADDLSRLFDYVDDFVDNKVTAVQAVVSRLSPGTVTMLDECGTVGPILGGLADPMYWVASGAYWAYFWARAAVRHGASVGVVGQSQFMDSPDREPGVTMMDWTTGNGTAKYWTTRLIVESTAMGDIFRQTETDAGAPVYAQAFTHGAERRVLLINKQNALTSVAVAGAASARVVDQLTNQGPPREEAGLNGTIKLGPFATAVITVAPAMHA
eukprot:g4543.t1